MDLASIWLQWEWWAFVARTRHYIATSPLYAWYEGPIVTTLGWGWPGLHIAIALLLTFYAVVVFQSEETFEKYNPGSFPPGGCLVGAYIALAIFAVPATLAGTHLADFRQLERAYPTLIPKPLPPRPATLARDVWYNANDPQTTRYFVKGPRVETTWLFYRKASGFLTALDFVILLTPLFLLFCFLFGASVPCFLFAFSYAREIRRPHAPTDIVNSALSGARIDGPKLADALSPTLAPVVRDSLGDKIERERLTALADRLQRDTARLDDKISKEAEIARLVVDHARKRGELADMEKRLRNMGVKRDG